MSRHFKADFCVDIGGGGRQGGSQGAQILHLVSRNVKAEFSWPYGGKGASKGALISHLR